MTIPVEIKLSIMKHLAVELEHKGTELSVLDNTTKL